MQYFDVFNGDADGICSLIQLRKHNPIESELITGVKRDVKLLKRIDSQQATSSILTVLDVSFESNFEDVVRLLEQGAEIHYFDHHKTGKLIKHKNLKVTINLSAEICTALLVNQASNSQFVSWAITGAYGDNLTGIANKLAEKSGFDIHQVKQMKKLGNLINYNAYGDDVTDLNFHPADLYRMMLPFDNPFEFMSARKDILDSLDEGYVNDFNMASKAKLIHQTNKTAVYELPNEKWSRRVSGVFGNMLANNAPDTAHAVIRQLPSGEYMISIRAPMNNKTGADVLASRFPTGGGRKGAAGVNALPERMLGDFIQAFNSTYN